MNKKIYNSIYILHSTQCLYSNIPFVHFAKSNRSYGDDKECAKVLEKVVPINETVSVLQIFFYLLRFTIGFSRSYD